MVLLLLKTSYKGNMDINAAKVRWFIRTKIFKILYGHIGNKSYLGSPLFVQRKRRLFIGNNVRIYPGLRAEITTQKAKIIIEDNVSIGQNCHLVSYDEDLIIGKNTTISGNVFISNVDHEYREIGVHVLNQKLKQKHTEIGENCFIGYGAVVLPGTVLGKQCIVGANSVVRGIFPDYSVIAGNPAIQVKSYDLEKGKWIKS